MCLAECCARTKSRKSPQKGGSETEQKTDKSEKQISTFCLKINTMCILSQSSEREFVLCSDLASSSTRSVMRSVNCINLIWQENERLKDCNLLVMALKYGWLKNLIVKNLSKDWFNYVWLNFDEKRLWNTDHLKAKNFLGDYTCSRL